MFSNAKDIGVCARRVLSLAWSWLRCKDLNIVGSVLRRYVYPALSGLPAPITLYNSCGEPYDRKPSRTVLRIAQPSNLNYAWNFGSLLAVCLGIQIVTGVTLVMLISILLVYWIASIYYIGFKSMLISIKGCLVI
jgi:hypothetical protein